MNLLIDLGNSRLKWAIEIDGQIGPVTQMDYRQADFLQHIKLLWQLIESPDTVAIASVSELGVFSGLLKLCQSLWPQAKTLVPNSTQCAYGVKNAYIQAEKLGVDRWLAMIAAHNHYPGDKCVVDCGTAITIDALQASGKHLGGLICPGLNLMKQALASNTADLTFNTEPYQTNLATATKPGIANGVLLAATGLVEAAIRQLDDSYQLIFTGGDAMTVAGSVSRPILLDQNLVLKGLSVFCQGAQTT
ncbi:MAG: type III pantothenate kinase [Methylomonas lenta]|nr:type III pantothenate kinase [Methylomonas lenta]